MSLRSDWKKTGQGIGDAFKSIGDDKTNTGASFGNAFKGLGKTIIKSAKVGAEKADEWANGDEEAEEKKDEGYES
ncbi:MAG: hypothetical protein K6F83_04965 [Clostridiales bacterium]|nr:hypothetical protein [Clostridiales bacterium]